MTKRTESFHWRSPDDVITFTHGGTLPQALIPPGIEDLRGSPIERQVIVAMKLRDAAGNLIGAGSELEYLDDDGRLQVFFTFVIPSRGTLFVHEVKGVDPELAEIFGAVAQTGKSWSGELSVVSTVGPSEQGLGVVVGGTGEFAGATGTMRQLINFKSISPDGPVAEQEEAFTFDLD